MSVGLSDLLREICGCNKENCGIDKIVKFLAATVKQEQVKPIIAVCKQLFGTEMENPVLVTGGRGTSKIIHFTAREKPYICRVTDATRPAFFINPECEIHNMWAVNPLGVAPRLHHADHQSGVIIMDYVQPIRLTQEMLEDEEHTADLYQELAEKVRTLHGGPAFTKDPTNIFTDLESTVKVAELKRVPQLAVDVLETIRSLEPLLKKHEECVPSHKDLHSNNVLYDGKKIFFIDWELGANCDRFVDLACVSIFYIFDSTKDEDLLRSYFGREPTEKEKAQLFLMKQACLCFYGFRLLRRVTGLGKVDLSQEERDPSTLPKFRDFILENYNGCSKSFTTEELKLFPFMFLSEAKKNIDSPAFKEAITALSE